MDITNNKTVKKYFSPRSVERTSIFGDKKFALFSVIVERLYTNPAYPTKFDSQARNIFNKKHLISHPVESKFDQNGRHMSLRRHHSSSQGL
jgi:hypothetical protein